MPLKTVTKLILLQTHCSRFMYAPRLGDTQKKHQNAFEAEALTQTPAEGAQDAP